MVERLFSQPLVTTGDFAPTRDDFQVIGVFNPGAVRFDDDVILLVRVAQGCAEKEDGILKSPRALVTDGAPEYAVDRFNIAAGGGKDHRKPLLETGFRRLAFVSHIEMVRLAADGRTVKEIIRHTELFGRTDYEIYGVEDPRITRIGDTYYITYVSVSDRMGVATSLMTTKNFEHFERHGVIFSCEDKDVVLFPEKTAGRYHCFHRPVGHIDIRKLAIIHASSPDGLDWGHHHYVLGCTAEGWHPSRIGAGTPPIRTDKGWLSIFHGVRHLYRDDPIGEYTAGAMLTDINEPWKVLAVSKEPFFRVEEEYELSGYVDNVVFPTGMVRDLQDPDTLLVYYGCADTVVAVTAFSEKDVLASLTPVENA